MGRFKLYRFTSVSVVVVERQWLSDVDLCLPREGPGLTHVWQRLPGSPWYATNPSYRRDELFTYDEEG